MSIEELSMSMFATRADYDAAALAQRVADLEAENAKFRQWLAESNERAEDYAGRVLKLDDECDELKEERDNTAAHVASIARQLGDEALQVDDIAVRVLSVVAERDALRARMAEIEEPVALVETSGPQGAGIGWTGAARPVGAALYTRPVPAQAVPDADAARYRWLCERFGVTQLPVLLQRAAGCYVADYKESIDATVDRLMIAAAPEAAR
jgi:hypothetical protein